MTDYEHPARPCMTGCGVLVRDGSRACAVCRQQREREVQALMWAEQRCFEVAARGWATETLKREERET